MLLYMVSDANRSGYRHLMRAFWDDAAAHGLALPTEEPISGPSFCEARKKLSSELLSDLLYAVAWPSADDPDSDARRWRGRRVFAVDGTKINLQRCGELNDAFGTPEGAYCPQVLLSVLVDVCARIPMDLEVSGFATSERVHLEKLLTSLDRGDVVVLDRGYPSHALLQSLSRQGIDFLIRLPSSHTFRAVDDLVEDGSTDRMVTIDPPESDSPDWRAIRTRIVRLTSPSGEDSFFFTSLPRTEFSRDDLATLYHMRWEAEEFYKLLKSDYIGQRQYRSRTASGIIQEIHAGVLFLAIARVCATAATQVVDPELEEQVSQKGAVLAIAAFLTRLLLSPTPELRQRALSSVLVRIATTRDRRRPGRASPRRSFKPTPKWAPYGRRGGA